MAIDFRLGEFCHPVRIARLRRTLERTQWLPPDELQAYQDRRVRAIVQHAVRRVPYYRRLFAEHGLTPSDIGGAADLARLPLLPKDVLREQPESLLAAGRRVPRWSSTSGTTAAPVRFVLDVPANVLEFCYYWRHWSWAGYRLGDPFAELGSTHFLARGLGDRAVYRQPHLRRLMLNSARLSPRSVPAMAAAVRRHRPRFLKGMASALYHFALLLEDAGCDDLSFDGVFSTGEVLTPAHRTVIERALHGRVLDSYGHMERTVAIAQCERGGYHVCSDYGVLELRAPRRSAGGLVLASVTGTSLHNLAMPLLRYDVGDDVEPLATQHPCPCGRTLPLVKAIHGRTQDTIQTPDGRFLTSVFVLFELVDGIRAAQVRQESRRRVVMLVVPGRGWDERQADRLRQLGHDLLGPEMRVDLVLADEGDLLRDASGKLRPVIGLEGGSGGGTGAS